ncbi:unnamed protein product [Sphagnum balticum]
MAWFGMASTKSQTAREPRRMPCAIPLPAIRPSAPRKPIIKSSAGVVFPSGRRRFGGAACNNSSFEKSFEKYFGFS